jgi:predicted DNA-binding transcriptional regulator AlpA
MEKHIILFLSDIQSGKLTKVEASDILGISRPTLDKRIQNKDFKKSEKALLKTLY